MSTQSAESRLLARLRSAPRADRIPAVARDGGGLPASYAQQRLWFLDQIGPDGGEYVVPFGFAVRGPLEVPALEAAVSALVARHEVLRTRFGTDAEGDPVQLVDPPAPVTALVLDADGPATADALLERHARSGFDLATGPVLRLVVVRVSTADGEPAEHRVLLAIHHIAADGWSAGILGRELAESYAAAREGRTPDLPALPIQYADYAAWQRDRLAGPAGDAHLAYWADRLAGLEPLELPTDRPRPPERSGEGGAVGFTVGAGTAAALKNLGAERGASVFMTGLALFQFLLSKYARRDDIAVGTPIAGRTHADTENLVGFFVNTLVLRTAFTPDTTVAELLTAVRDSALDAYAHQDLPFERLVEHLSPERDLSRNPLVSTMFVLQNGVGDTAVTLPGCEVAPVAIGGSRAKFDLNLTMAERPDGSLEAEFVYAADLFDRATIERMAGHFTALADAIAAAGPDTRLAELDMLTPGERAEILDGWNDNAAAYPDTATIHGLVEATAAARPDAVAVRHGDLRLTLAEVDERANRLARHLRWLGAGPGTLVAICLERGADAVTALLAVLKAGAAFVPLDPEYPAARLEFMLADTAAPIVITHSALTDRLPETEAALIAVDEETERLAAYPGTSPGTIAGPDDLAYIIYTSGSTGKPKGVMLDHRGVVNYLAWCDANYPPSAEIGTYLYSSITFDLTITALFLPLMQGTTIAVPVTDAHTNAFQATAADLLAGTEVSFLKATPSHLELLATMAEESGASLGIHSIVAGGEELTAALTRRILARSSVPTTIVNEYGATEGSVANVMSLTREIPDDAVGGVNVGRAVQNTAMYIVDQYGQPVPIGVPGEALLGGICVARGYLNRGELTAQRFVADPFSETPGARMYHTGDLVKWLPDGTGHFLGRIDNQVKLRGYRIELGEIEAAILTQPGITAATVIVREDTPGDKRLTAYLTGDTDTTVLRETLRVSLPDYMVPVAYITLDTLPLTVNGKVDVKALPAPDTDRRDLADEYTAPSTPTEQAVAAVWCDVLGLDRVGVHDDFFRLGGHSLLATRVVTRLRRDLGADLTVRDLFTAPTVAALAARTSVHTGSDDGIPPADRGRPLPLSFAQQRLWFLDQMDPGSAEYLVPYAMRVRGRLDLAALETAVSGLAARHEVLRTRYVADADGRPAQIIDLPAPVRARVLDGTDPRAAIAAEARRPVDLAAGPVLRLAVARVSDDDHHVLVLTHHIASDGWSTAVIGREIAELYAAATEGREPQLPAVPVQYADYAAWQRDRLTGDRLDAQLGYWTDRLAGLEPLELPTDRPRPPERTGNGDAVTFALPARTSAGLKSLASERGGTLFMSALAAFQLLLSKYARQSDIAVGTPIAGRDHADLNDLVGFFVNTLVLRTDLAGLDTVADLFDAVRGGALDAYAHAELPFERLVDHIAPDRDLSRNPLFQTMFVLQNASEDEDGAWRLPGCTIEPEDTEAGRAKFDLTLTLADRGDGMEARFTYATDLFDRATIERMAGHFATLADAIAAAGPDTRLAELDMLTPGERAEILDGWNDNAAAYPDTATIHGLVEATAAARPDAVAVRHGDVSVTYVELEERANRLARHLRDLGAGPGTLVGICLERGIDAVTALLGVLKAGAAFVPLDPEYPAARLEFMLADTAAPIVITGGTAADHVPDTAATVVHLDRDRARITAAHSAEPPTATAGPDDLAYIIYTSGSTGKPKGVMLDHRGVVNYLAWCDANYPPSAEIGTYLYSSITFDLTITALFLPLMQGLTIAVPATDGETTAFQATAEDLLAGTEVSFLKATPSHLEMLLTLAEQTGARLGIHSLVAGGEELTASLARRIFERSSVPVTIVNEYGATEGSVANVMSLTREIPDDAVGGVNVGRAVQNTAMYIVDQYGQPVPIGVPGEALLGGICVARGYLNRGELTAQRFVADPFSETPGARMYHTGDLVKWLPDGTGHFLGRIDNQVKLRGYRIELGEIEAAILTQPGVTAATVIVREDTPGDKRLTAYVTGDTDTTALKAALKQGLPDYMVPVAYVTLDTLPLTVNGKVDTTALPTPEAGRGELSSEYTEPTTPAEHAVTAVWREILGVDRIGVHDNFFELGGDSILSIQVIARAKRYGLHLTPRMIFQHQTVATIAAHARATSEVHAEQGTVTGPIPLTPIQHWLLEQDRPDLHHFNQSVLLHTDDLDPGILDRAFTALAGHHDALRCRYEDTGDGWHQEVTATAPTGVVTVHDLSGLAGTDRWDAMLAASEETQRGMDLAAGRLVRAALIDLGDDGQRLLIAIHHLVVDGVSWRVLLEDLGHAYATIAAGDRPVFAMKTTSFQQWAHKLADLAVSDKAVEELPYWSGPVTAARLPRDRDGANALASARAATAALTRDETDALLRDVPKAFGTRINDALLTAFAAAVRDWTGGSTYLHLEGHGREDLFTDVDLSRTVGWFTSVYPVELRFDDSAGLAAAIHGVRDTLEDVPNRGIGYGLLRYLGDDEARRTLRDLPEPEIIFNYLGQFNPGVPGIGRFADPREPRSRSISPAADRDHLIEVGCDIRDGVFSVDVGYSARIHDDATAEHLAAGMLTRLRDLIAEAGATVAGTGLTPQDFPLAGIDDADLAAIIERFA